jgi:hypothetical protein
MYASARVKSTVAATCSLPTLMSVLLMEYRLVGDRALIAVSNLLNFELSAIVINQRHDLQVVSVAVDRSSSRARIRAL